MQNDLISRSALRRHIIAFATGCHTAYLTIENIVMMINQADTVDAVEVVRCKDCEHWHKGTDWCSCHSHFITPDGAACHPWESANWKMFEGDDFCSYGERRTDDGK